MHITARVLVTIGSAASIGFGLWHFTVPRVWKWYGYIDAQATELVAAVRAVNIFFSLCLVLFGAINLLLVHSGRADRYAIIVVLAANCILWLTRVVLQLVYPQGSMNPALRYGMLSAFVVVFLCYLGALYLSIFGKTGI